MGLGEKEADICEKIAELKRADEREDGTDTKAPHTQRQNECHHGGSLLIPHGENPPHSHVFCIFHSVFHFDDLLEL